MDDRILIKRNVREKVQVTSKSKDRLYLKVKYFTYLFKSNELQNRCKTFIVEIYFMYVHFNNLSCHTDHHTKIFMF